MNVICKSKSLNTPQKIKRVYKFVEIEKAARILKKKLSNNQNRLNKLEDEIVNLEVEKMHDYVRFNHITQDLKIIRKRSLEIFCILHNKN